MKTALTVLLCVLCIASVFCALVLFAHAPLLNVPFLVFTSIFALACFVWSIRELVAIRNICT